MQTMRSEPIKEKNILIFGEPGPLRGSIQGFLSTFPLVKNYFVSNNEELALDLLKEFDIHLVILDFDGNNDQVLTLLQNIHSSGIPTRSLALVDDEITKDILLCSGATTCILKGFAPQQLADNVEKLFIG